MPEDVFLRRAQERAHDGGRRKTLTGVGVGIGVALAAAAGIAVLGGALDHDGNDSDPHQVVSEGTVDATGPAIVSDVESTFYPAAQVVGT
ncbi:MAG: hypothetical protein JWN22_2539, partial [Nocardioides sp.]|nr:hypothetical protein [Nocardioides sp.]